MRAIYNEPRITEADIWDSISGEDVRDDSAEADLFHLLIHELSTGRVIRQERETNYAGQFMRKMPAKRPRRKGATGTGTIDPPSRTTEPCTPRRPRAHMHGVEDGSAGPLHGRPQADVCPFPPSPHP
jgi:hypothetical protein